MTNEQLYILLGFPMLLNATLLGLVLAVLIAKIAKVESSFESRFDAVNSRIDAVISRFDSVNSRFDGIDERFDDMHDLWRAELRRVEEVLDARLKHIERD